MPPMYDWHCEKCGKWESTVYPIEERDTSPDEKKSENCEVHEWKRHISGKQAVTKGRNWGGGKGNW